MFHPRLSFGMGGVVASLFVLAMTLAFSRTASAGDPNQATGPHFSISGDPDSPLGEQGDPDSPLGEQGDPDSPLGKKNGSPLILAIDRMSRSQVRIHVAFLGDPDNPTQVVGYRAGSGLHLNAYDVTGRLRRQWDVQNVLAQGGNVTWDLRDDRGARVPSGIYFVQFRGQSSAVTERVIALR